MTVWDGFVGHPRTAKLLESASRHPTGPYLFVGAPGAGQRSAARLFASAVLCPQMCGECNTCSRVVRGIHPDVTIFQPEGYTYPVEVLRIGVAAAAQSPIEASHRVFILEEADRITERSQNALLKALEEPAPRVVWILVADSVHPFLPTILSRCQMIDFPPMEEETLRSLMESKYGLAAAAAEEIVRVSRGDLDVAIRLAEQPLTQELRMKAFEVATHTRPALRRVFGAVEDVMGLSAAARAAAEKAQAEELMEWSEARTGRRGGTALQKRLASSHRRALRRVETEVQIEFLAWLGAAFREFAVLSSRGDEEALIQSQFADAREAARMRPTTFWIDMVEACLEAQLALRSNANAPLVLESLLLRLL